MTGAVTEGVLVVSILCISTVVVVVAWLVYLGRGGRPVNLLIEAPWIRVRIDRPSPVMEQKDEET